MKTIKLVLIIVTAAVIPLSIYSSGCRHFASHHFDSDSPDKMADKIAEHIADELDLDNAQREKLDKIKSEIIQKHKERRKEMEPVFDEIHNELSKENISKENLIAQMDLMGNTHKEMHPFIADKLIEFKSMLTKEQKETLAKKMKEFKEKFNH